MRVLIAPDSFAGTLSPAEAADALAAGWRTSRPDDDVRCLPMSDGGDGLLDVVAGAIPDAQRRSAEVANARGYAVDAQWLVLPDGRAVIESARACGLHRLPPGQRNPRLATTYGVGQLLAAAVAAGATDVIIGLGGSATVDGGAGLATALGFRLLRSDGNGVKVGGEYLSALDRIAAQAQPPITVTVACDVDAPLLGDRGAVAGFGAQKGAAPEDLPVFETALTRLADVAERDLPGGPWRDIPGAGAAGGLGFGLAAFIGAGLKPGAQLIGELIGLHDSIDAADIVITGEGRLDEWSLRGKVPGVVAGLARHRGKKVLAVTGSSQLERHDEFDAVALLGPQGQQDPAGAVAAAAATLAADL